MRQPLLAATLVLALAACSGGDTAEGAVPDAASAEAAQAQADAATAAAGDGARAASGKNARRTAVYSQTFTHKRQSYMVDVDAAGTRSTVTVTPKGMGLSNKVITRQIDGVFNRAQMADLDGDGEPEIYVFLKSADGRDRASAFIVASDQGRRMVEVPVPDLAADAKHSAGYRGGDEFAIVEKVLARRFPLHDAGGEPTGTMRQMQYKLVKGASGPELKLDQAPEF
ncbi:MAG: lipoprotein [Lysobacter sp.]|nr:lipoprotein [Lysobacter sp.]